MNFLTRNLGWLLLLLFFLFMLFVISTNDQTKMGAKINSLSGTTLEENIKTSVDAEEELNNLVKRVDNENENEVLNETITVKTASGEVLEVTEKKKGFFSFFNRGEKKTSEEKGEKEIRDDKNSEENTSEDKVEENITGEEKSEEETEEVLQENIIEEKTASGEIIENTGSGETLGEQGENKSLFDKLFGKKEISEDLEESRESKEEDSESVEENSSESDEKNTNSEVLQENKKITKTEVKDSEEKVEVNKTETKTTVVKSAVQNVGGNISKKSGAKKMLANASLSYMHQYPKEVQEAEGGIIYPGLNLKTAVGKQFEVGVHMLKLNNANFDVKLALMNKGDRLKQLTKENSYGCFLIEIVHAKNSHNIGKQGYVCKKYLQEASLETTKKSVKQSIKNHTVAPVEPVHSSTQSESFLPEDSETIEKTMVPTESFLPEEVKPVEKRIVPAESFLPEEPIIIDSTESFLPLEEIK